MKHTLHELEGWGENCIILFSTVFDWSTTWRSDVRTGGQTGDSIQRAKQTVCYIQGAPKSNPVGKIYISEIVADIFTKFAEFTDEDSVHIACKFY